MNFDDIVNDVLFELYKRRIFDVTQINYTLIENILIELKRKDKSLTIYLPHLHKITKLVVGSSISDSDC